jgi:hypothetical protein
MVHIDSLSALAAGIVILMIVSFVVLVVGGVCYLALSTWLKTRHLKLPDKNNE